MKINIIAVISAICILASCASGPRTVDFPTVGAVASNSVIIEKVELSDTLTSLHIRGYNRPGWWIKVVSQTHLVADGRKYEMTGTEGITPDEYLWMPEDGDSLFVLHFAPLPLNTKSFDFIEGYEEGAFRLLDVDLTGRLADAYKKGLPRRIHTTSVKETEVPGFVYEIGESTIRLHILGYKPELGNRAQIYLSDLISEQSEHNVELDPQTGTGVVKFRQYGTYNGFVAMSGISLGSFHIAPGESVDIWCDAGFYDYWITQIRRTEKPVRDIKQLYSEGSIYDALNNLPFHADKLDKIRIRHFSSCDVEDFKLSADEYVALIQKEYNEAAALLEETELHPLTKKYTSAGLKMQAIGAICNADHNRIRSYRRYHGVDWSEAVDYVPDLVTDRHIHMVADQFDLSDPIFEICRHNTYRVDPEYEKVMTAFVAAFEEALNGNLTEEKLSEMQSWENQFYAKMCEDIDRRAKEVISSGSERMQPVPEVPLDELFEAIIAPHKGKVVLVDFWNTWCGPCRQALAANEPYKSAELSSEDIVWIYIANETSPIEKYLNMIPEIAGLHYMLNQEQWDQITHKDFDIDGIPSYVLVNRDGSYRLRNDLRDHSLLLSTLKSM